MQKSYTDEIMNAVIRDVDIAIHIDGGISYALSDSLGNYFSRSSIFDQELDGAFVEGLKKAIMR